MGIAQETELSVVQLGQVLPDITLPCTSGKVFKTSQLKDKFTILYFYPKNHSPGCTIEAQDFSANFELFEKKNCQIFGVSRDKIEKHEAFKQEQSLPFELIGDVDHQLCDLLGVIEEKEMFGKTIMSLSRSTFLFNQSGELIMQWRKVDVRNHIHDVMKVIESSKLLKKAN
ncbi:peroxiredoxin [Marinicellulosiphila megalodicopiae]|uniref:peroxiredoxin n=1 Tax=Marinicellulosiphila megalodicopiae TaxID=2724896 RepID=UPI003BB058E9